METKPPESVPPAAPKSILTRIYVTEGGDIVVTDLWESLEQLLIDQKGFSKS